jgi:hypothetical protein
VAPCKRVCGGQSRIGDGKGDTRRDNWRRLRHQQGGQEVRGEAAVERQLQQIKTLNKADPNAYRVAAPAELLGRSEMPRARLWPM